MIELVELPELVVIGIAVEGRFEDLSRVVPDAWTRLFEAETGATAFLEVSTGAENGVYRELVGFMAATATDVPEGMTRLVVPSQRYLRLVHTGPLAEIYKGFSMLYAHADRRGLRTTEFKLDFGYAPGLADAPHELHVALAPATLSLA